MWALQQEISVHGFSPYSFLVMLAVFVGLGILLTRGSTMIDVSPRGAGRKIRSLKVSRKPHPQQAQEERKLAA